MTNLQKLPSDVLGCILEQLQSTVPDLVQWKNTSRALRSVHIKEEYWFKALKHQFPQLTCRIVFKKMKHHPTFWRDAALALYSMKSRLSSLSLCSLISERPFVPAGLNDLGISLNEQDRHAMSPMMVALNTPEQRAYPLIQGKRVFDIDRVIEKGVVGLVKYRGSPESGYESLITLWEQPSWRLVRSFKVNFLCQLTNIQTIWMYTDNGVTKMTFLSLHIGELTNANGKTHLNKLLVYRLLDNTQIQFIASLNLGRKFISTDVFFFSQASWRVSSDGDNYHAPKEDIKEWLQCLSPKVANFTSKQTVFAMALGSETMQRNEMIPFKLDISKYATSHEITDDMTEHIDATGIDAAWPMNMPGLLNSTVFIRQVPRLAHLLVGRNLFGGLNIIDWRFGVLVGKIPGSNTKHQELKSLLKHGSQSEEQSIHFNLVRACGGQHMIAPFLPQSAGVEPTSKEAMLNRGGLRFVTVNQDLRSLEITSWNLSYMLDVVWDPVSDKTDNSEVDENSHTMDMIMRSRYPWWSVASERLRSFAKIQPKWPYPYSPSIDDSVNPRTFRFERRENTGHVYIHDYKVWGNMIALTTAANEFITIDLELGSLHIRNDVSRGSQDNCDTFVIDTFNNNEITFSNSKTILHGALV